MRTLKLFLVYSLLWPITMGDKMVHLAAPTTAPPACSSPWTLYRDLGRTLFDAADGPQADGAFRVQPSDASPGLLPLQKPQTAPCAEPSSPAAPLELDRRPPRRPRLQLLPRDSPILARLPLSKN